MTNDVTAVVPPTLPPIPLDEKYYILNPDEAEFFKGRTGIQDDGELRAHILKIQREAYDIHAYPCIRRLTFTKLKVARFPIYPHVLRLGKDRPDEVLLDIGTCFGNDVRKAVLDGFPAQNIVATDLVPDFWTLGHKLFNDTPETFPVTFLTGNVFDPAHIAPGAPLTTPPATPPPSLSSLSSLNPLRGHVSALNVTAFFHLFSEEQQLQLARLFAGLLSPRPGSVVFGSHVAREKAGIAMEPLGGNTGLEHRMFCHSPDSWSAMWDGEVFEKGTVKVEAKVIQASSDIPYIGVIGQSWLMVWSVTRL